MNPFSDALSTVHRAGARLSIDRPARNRGTSFNTHVHPSLSTTTSQPPTIRCALLNPLGDALKDDIPVTVTITP
jgi:hypothetical protein